MNPDFFNKHGRPSLTPSIRPPLFSRKPSLSPLFPPATNGVAGRDSGTPIGPHKDDQSADDYNAQTRSGYKEEIYFWDAVENRVA